MLKSFSPTGISIVDFSKKILRDVALDQITSKTFDYLKNCALINNLPISDSVEIYEAKLTSSAYSNDVGSWVEYHGFLKGYGMHLEAKRVFERAMLSVTDKQALL